MSKLTMKNLVVKNPVAKFYYQGTHSHPVRRTVLVVEETKDTLKGYELREGNVVRKSSKAPVRVYSKSLIANSKNYCRLTNSKLNRLELLDLINEGV